MQENYLKKIGERIKKLRKEQKLTLSSLSYKNGLEPSTVSRVEKAQVDVKLSTFLKIAEALGTKPEELIKE